MTVKAIETQYNGYRFRSRLEARWAVFLDELRAFWEYEKEGYRVGSVGWYLPDFTIRCGSYSVWFEIKGSTPTNLERERCSRLSLEADSNVWVLSETPGTERVWVYDKGELVLSMSHPDTQNLWCFAFDLCSAYDHIDETLPDHTCPIVARAYASARSARFEHGETPKVQRGRQSK